MKGRLVIHSRCLKTGLRKKIVDVENLILDTMYHELISLLGGTGSQAYIAKMMFGTGNLAPASTQTFLSRPITPAKAVIITVDVDNFNLTCEASLLSDEANGFPISEAGLLTFSQVLVTRAIFDARTKTADFVFDFNWTIYTKAP